MLKITAIGNLTNDVTLKTNETTGKPYAILRIASDRRYKDRLLRQQFLKPLKRVIYTGHLVFVQNDPAIRQPPCFRNGGAVASEGCKRRKLRSPIMERHSRMRLRLRMRQADDIVIISVHALCPPIWPFRSLAVAPSR